MKDKQLYLFGFQKDRGKENIRPKIIFPLDTLILLLVVIILLLVLSFSLGVERGRKFAFNKLISDQKELAESIDSKKDLLVEKISGQKEEVGSSQDAVPDKKTEVETQKLYRIQVASFHKENTAYQEAKRLEKEGYPVLVAKKGKYVVIYVGSFDNEKEAKENLKLLRKKYGDCILRKLDDHTI